jgi:hypothetical protein
MIKIAFNNPISVKVPSVSDEYSFSHKTTVKPDTFQTFLPHQAIKRTQIPLTGSQAGRINLSARLKNGKADVLSFDDIKNSAVELTPNQTKKDRPIVLRKSSRLVLNQGQDSTCGIMACGMMLHTLGKPMDENALLAFFEETLEANIRKEGVEFAYISIILRGLVEHLDPQFKIRTKYKNSVDDVVSATGFGYPAIAGLKLDENCYHVVVVDFPAIVNGQQCLAIRDSSGTQEKNQYFMTNKTFKSLFMGALIYAEKQIGC